jgi:hypothetical protein
MQASTSAILTGPRRRRPAIAHIASTGNLACDDDFCQRIIADHLRMPRNG